MFVLYIPWKPYCFDPLSCEICKNKNTDKQFQAPKKLAEKKKKKVRKANSKASSCFCVLFAQEIPKDLTVLCMDYDVVLR